MRGTMLIRISGGPFDGGTIEAPRRTTTGLVLALVHGDVRAEYQLVSEDGQITASPLTETAPLTRRMRRTQTLEVVVPV